MTKSLQEYKTTVQSRQCPSGHRRDCQNKKTCMFRHLDECVGDPISKYIAQLSSNSSQLHLVSQCKPIKDIGKIEIIVVDDEVSPPESSESPNLIYEVPMVAELLEEDEVPVTKVSGVLDNAQCYSFRSRCRSGRTRHQ